MMVKLRHTIGMTGTLLLLGVLLTGPAAHLQAQSAQPPPGSTPAPADPSGADQPEATDGPPLEAPQPGQERERDYRRQNDDLKSFVPSEEIRVDKAVDFPADI